MTVFIENLPVAQPFKKFPRLLGNPNFYYHARKSPPLVPIISQSTPFHFFEIHFNIIVASNHISSGMYLTVWFYNWIYIRRDADKSLAFPIFLCAAQPKDFFLDGLKKLEQRRHKRVELRGEYVEWIHFFNPVARCFLYKAEELSAPLVYIINLYH
jgi:hypothetical protein